MASPKLGEKGYKGPVHEATRAAQRAWDSTGGEAVGRVQKAASGALNSGADIAGAAGQIPGNVQSGLQGIQSGIGSALGSIFGGGNEKSASPQSIGPARAISKPTSSVMTKMPAATARPLVMGSSGGPPAPKMGGGKQVKPFSMQTKKPKVKQAKSGKNKKGK